MVKSLEKTSKLHLVVEWYRQVSPMITLVNASRSVVSNA